MSKKNSGHKFNKQQVTDLDNKLHEIAIEVFTLKTMSQEEKEKIYGICEEAYQLIDQLFGSQLTD